MSRVVRGVGVEPDPRVVDRNDPKAMRDYRKRLDLIVNEINKLCSMSITEIDEWYKSMDKVLIHNFNHMKKIFDSRVQGKRINIFVDNLFIVNKNSYVKIHEDYSE